MKLLNLFSLFALVSIVAFSQKSIVPLTEQESKPVLKFRSEIKVEGFGEYIIAKKFLDDEDRLLLITNFGIQLWNTKTAERIQSRAHEIMDLEMMDSVFVISPDGSKIIVMDAFNMSLKKLLGKKGKRPAVVYSLETGKRLAVLQRPDNSIRRAIWSRDGKTLVTFSNAFGQGYDNEVSFWDGETLEHRGSLRANKWIYLTRGGDKFITTSGVTKNALGYKYEKPNSINIWSTATGKIEKTISLTKEKSLKNIRITEDDRFLLAENDKRIILLNLETGVQQNFSAKDSTPVEAVQMSDDRRFLAAENNGKILVWEIGGNGLPKFEVTARPPAGKEKWTTGLRGFSLDGQYLVISQLKYEKVVLFFKIPVPTDTEFYDLETGQRNPDLKFFINQERAVFSADRHYAILRNCENATVASLEKQQELFTFPLKCKRGETSSFENGETKYESYYYNDDIIAFHPRKNASLVVKDDFLEIYGVNPEQKRLQIIDAPRPLSKKFTTVPSSTGSIDDILTTFANRIDSLNPEINIASAGFLFDGEVVFATSADRRSIFFWDVDKNLID